MSCAATATMQENEVQPFALMGATRADVEGLLESMGQPKFRAKQLWHWLYWHGASSFETMHTLPKTMLAALESSAHLKRPAEASVQQSVDGTRKWLLQFEDGRQAETVFIPDLVETRGTLCISSQVGCTLTCAFCHTGTQKLVRNLTAAEIVQQFIVARDHLGEWPTPSNGVARRLSNVVMMGMGEPLFNYENVKEALKVLMDPEGLALSKRRITLSTSGVVPRMQQCGEEIGVNLAVSLHAVRDDVRDILVPLNKKYPIKDLLDACRRYPGTHNNRRITFEYVMLDDVNDSDADAKELARLVEDIPAKINLIPFNPWPGTDYECSSSERIERFSEILNDKGLAAPVRTPRGRDILAACGQLKSASERAKGEKVKL